MSSIDASPERLWRAITSIYTGRLMEGMDLEELISVRAK